MKIHQIKKTQKRTNRTRVGRGNAGKGGTTAGRGTKGQKARTGYKITTGFEGGQTKLVQRLPKVAGFKSIQTKPVIVKTSQINANFTLTETVSLKSLVEKGLIDKDAKKVKILFDKKLNSAYSIKDCTYSKKVASQIKK